MEYKNGTLGNVIGALSADSFTYGNVSSSFSMLLDKIFFVIEHGRSVRYNHGIYILKSERYTVDMIPMKNEKKLDCKE